MLFNFRGVALVALVFALIDCGYRERSDVRGDAAPPAVQEQPVLTAPTTEPMEGSVAGANLRVTTPPDGANVSISEPVRGSTQYSAHHYIIVTPESTPTVRWVQNGPAKLRDGTWFGTAQFGEGDIGLNENFYIRCLVTSATLPAGKLSDDAFPNDAVLSEPVKVRRTR